MDSLIHYATFIDEGWEIMNILANHWSGFKPFSDFNNGFSTQPQQVSGSGESHRKSTQPSLDSVERFLDKQIFSALGREAKTSEGLVTAPYTGQDSEKNAAAKVVNYVRDLYHNLSEGARDPSKIDLFFDQIREGIEQGFSSARSILEASGHLEPKISASVDRIYDLIQAGIGQLEVKPTDSVPVASQQALTSRIEELAEASLVVTTRDGDTVTISLQHYSESTESAFGLNGGGQHISGFESSNSTGSQVHVTIEGDLDKSERRAIEKLVKRIDKVSQRFFDGDIQAAFKKASKLGLNSSQLAGFSLNLYHQKSVELASTYSGQLNSVDNGENMNQFRGLADFVNQLRSVHALIGSSVAFLNDSGTLFGDLLEAVIGLRNENVDEGDEDSSRIASELVETIDREPETEFDDRLPV